MEKDIVWNVFFENEERFADLINGCGLNGKQMVKPEDLKPADTKNLQYYGTDTKDETGEILNVCKTGKPKKRNGKSTKSSTVYRDIVRKVAFGVNFAMIGIENQETINYALPLAIMRYDAGEYEKQKREISRKIRQPGSGAKEGEFLYGFSKESRLHPVVTFVLYSGEEWDGGRSLNDIIDFTDIPEELKGLVQNYKVNLVEIRKWKDTSVFKTDIRQVFDFIRYSKNKEQVKKLVLDNPDYEKISEDAYDVMKQYANISELKTEKVEGEKNMVNMAKGLQDWAEEERAEGRREGIQSMVRIFVKNMLKCGMSDEDILMLSECDRELLEEVKKSIQEKR